MIKEKVKIVVPSSLEEITLGQYQDYLKDIKNKDQKKHAEYINRKLVQHICNIDQKYIDKIPFKDVSKLLSILSDAFNKKYDLVKRFKLLDVEMGFIPKLDDMSLGEYVDVENFLGDWHNMHKAMAVLYRPVNFKKKERYTIADYSPSDEISLLMKEMPLNIVMGSVVFFYRLGMELSKATLTYIRKTLKTDTTLDLKEALQKHGVGINQYMLWLEEISENLTKLQNYQFINALPSYPSKNKKMSLKQK
tara:strand:+ start:3662 stop:4408 length:747 start_codon:yes stop_codon:yes gene_type:complete